MTVLQTNKNKQYGQHNRSITKGNQLLRKELKV